MITPFFQDESIFNSASPNTFRSFDIPRGNEGFNTVIFISPICYIAAYQGRRVLKQRSINAHLSLGLVQKFDRFIPFEFYGYKYLSELII